jgi:LysM repeat protein
MNKLLALTFLITFSFSAFGNTPKISLEEYIETWKDVAVNQMHSHGVPASITLSQGILESGFGNSKLAVQANNHFGIKCHDWSGDTFLKDDDRRNECFRKYSNAAQSFQDHSEFLTSRSRYSALFELEMTDYKGWAKGLKTAGYATNPSYDKKLIDLIQRYDLHQFDELPPTDWIVEDNATNKKTSKLKRPSFSKSKRKINKESKPSIENGNSQHQVFINKNRTKYIVAGNHDTFYQISKEFSVSLHQLNRWNDFPSTKDVLTAGDKVYIMRKRKRIDSNLAEIKINDPQKLWKISQKYGIQLKALAELNNLIPSEVAMNKEGVILP